jgi:hypothetical protein
LLIKSNGPQIHSDPRAVAILGWSSTGGPTLLSGRVPKGCAYNAAIIGALVRARGWGRKQVEQGTRAEARS